MARLAFTAGPGPGDGAGLSQGQKPRIGGKRAKAKGENRSESFRPAGKLCHLIEGADVVHLRFAPRKTCEHMSSCEMSSL